MSRNAIVWGRLVFGLLSYVVVGFLFTWTPLWAEALGMNEALSSGKALALSRASLIVLALTLTWGFAWTKVGVISGLEIFGWVWVLTYGVGIPLGLVMGGGITFTIVWVIVVGVAWAGAWSLVGARNQLLLSFSPIHTVLILAGTTIFGLGLGGLGCLMSWLNP